MFTGAFQHEGRTDKEGTAREGRQLSGVFIFNMFLFTCVRNTTFEKTFFSNSLQARYDDRANPEPRECTFGCGFSDSFGHRSVMVYIHTYASVNILVQQNRSVPFAAYLYCYRPSCKWG